MSVFEASLPWPAGAVRADERGRVFGWRREDAVAVLHVPEGRLVSVRRSGHDLALSPDGDRLIVVHPFRDATLLDARTLDPLGTWPAAGARVVWPASGAPVVLDPSAWPAPAIERLQGVVELRRVRIPGLRGELDASGTLAAVETDAALELWNLEDGAPCWTRGRGPAPITLERGRERFFGLRHLGAEVELFVATARDVNEVARLAPPGCAVWSPDGGRVAYLDDAGRVCVASGEVALPGRGAVLVEELARPLDWMSAAWSGDGRRLLVADSWGGVRVLEPENPRQIG